MLHPRAQVGSRAGVDARLPTPLYHQIFLVLSARIADGVYVEGDQLPSEDETARSFGVSRITAKRALDELAEAGLVTRQRGRGTRVAPRPAAGAVRAGVEGLLENLIAMGLETTVELVEMAYVPAPEPIAALLGCAPRTAVQRAVRVRSIDNEPFSHLTTHVPETLGRSFSERELASTALLALLERAGVQVSRADQTITATLADGVVAGALGVELGAALLRIERTVYDQQDCAVEHIVGLYRPDRYQYRMALSRVHGEQANAWSPASEGAG